MNEDLVKEISKKVAAGVVLASGVTFDIEVLRKERPEGVLPDKKEQYLSDAQF